MNSSSYPPFAVTVDLVVLTIRAQALHVLVVARGEEPYAGRLALPGGFVRIDEDLPQAAARELAEETGLSLDAVHLEQLATYGTPDRDPRMRVVTVAHLALVPNPPRLTAGTDAAAAYWKPAAELAGDQLAFDHGRILADGLERARAKLEYSSLATAFCPPEFTIAELRQVYEIVWGTKLDPRNFHRKVTGTPGFLEPAGQAVLRHERGRPAQLYRKGAADVLYPPMLRQPQAERAGG